MLTTVFNYWHKTLPPTGNKVNKHVLIHVLESQWITVTIESNQLPMSNPNLELHQGNRRVAACHHVSTAPWGAKKEQWKSHRSLSVPTRQQGTSRIYCQTVTCDLKLNIVHQNNNWVVFLVCICSLFCSCQKNWNIPNNIPKYPKASKIINRDASEGKKNKKTHPKYQSPPSFWCLHLRVFVPSTGSVFCFASWWKTKSAVKLFFTTRFCETRLAMMLSLIGFLSGVSKLILEQLYDSPTCYQVKSGQTLQRVYPRKKIRCLEGRARLLVLIFIIVSGARRCFFEGEGERKFFNFFSIVRNLSAYTDKKDWNMPW